MSIAAHPQREEIVCGVNSSQDALHSGQNQNCRVYNVKENKSVTRPPFLYAFFQTCHLRISLSTTRSTLELKGEDDDYQVSC